MIKKVAALEKVSKTYGKDDLIVKALDNVNLDIYKGDYLAVMGASGSGKSTAMNIIGCLAVSYTHLTLPTTPYL